jgi:hypothetical protein
MGRACNTYGTDERNAQILVGKPAGRDRYGDIGVDETIILKWNLKRVRECELDLNSSGQAPVAGSREHSNGP